jgi:misacylated tRNA(Ala) deacylase
MRMHTSAHILSDLAHRRTGALITGNQLGIDKTRIDFNLEDFNKEEFSNFVAEANSIMSEEHKVTISYMEREQALKMPSMVKLAKAIPPTIKELRIVKIGEVDMQADGGTHVKNTKEVGKIEIVELKNKGKNNRRLYYKLKE